MEYNIISTGSQGNAVVINKMILIDCGVPFKVLQSVYKDLKLVLLTHIHSDHFKKSAIKKLSAERPTLRFGCCKWLVPALIDCGVPKSNIDVFEIGKVYDYRAFKVSTVKLYHNVPNAGYRLFFGEEKAFYATDTGHLEGISAKDYNLYLIEANYADDELKERIDRKVKNGEYCYEFDLPNRHLSREQASAFLLENMGQESEYVFLHIHKGDEDLCKCLKLNTKEKG